MKRTMSIQVSCLFIWMGISGLAFAQVPQLMNYQGLLTGPATGEPVADDTYEMVFSIYDVSTGGSAVWTESKSVQTQNGLYSVLLGSTTPLTATVLSGPEKYLGIKVGTDEEMTPRKRIVSTAYAIMSEEAENSWRLTGNSATTAGTNFLGTTDSEPLVFKINGAEAMRINATGNVGIGTTNPQKLLHIKGSGGINEVLIEEVFAGAAAQLFLKNPTRQWMIFADSSPDQFGIFDNNQNAARLVIDGNGNVGIGTTSPTNILTVKQNSNTDPVADAWTTYSSRRWKTNIKPIEEALDKVKRLRGVSYDWKADGKHDIGLIAEEVGEVIPEVVVYEDNGTDAKSVNYARLVAVLIEAVKAQQKQIEKQQKTMDGLIERVTVLEKASQRMAPGQFSKISKTTDR